MIKINNVHKFYGTKENRQEVLKGINCHVEQGEICTLLGPSGSGKSTILNIVGGIDTFDEGEILIDSISISSMNKAQLSDYRRLNLGFVFQFYNLVPNLTVQENIEVGAYISPNPLAMEDLLEKLGLWEHRKKLPNQLSGGQQQRCSIGRALIKNPKILLCDEPTGALDYQTSKDILALIQKINQEFHTTTVIVTHNQEIKHMSNRVMRLHDGHIKSEYLNDKIINAHDLEW